MSVATTARWPSSLARAIATQPLPVPTSSTTRAAALRSSAPIAALPDPRCQARARRSSGPAHRRQRFLDDELGLGPRDEDVGRDLEVEAPELAVPGQVGDRLARRAPRDRTGRARASKPVRRRHRAAARAAWRDPSRGRAAPARRRRSPRPTPCRPAATSRRRPRTSTSCSDVRQGWWSRGWLFDRWRRAGSWAASGAASESVAFFSASAW